MPPLPTIVVDGFLIDDENEAKFWRHGLTAEQVTEVLDHPRRIRRNRRSRPASHLVIGRDERGQCLAIPIEPTHDPTVWRPVASWPCKPGKWALLP